MKTYKLLGFAFTTILLMAGVSYAQLSGNYTIGGSSPDYVSISDAVNELQTNGISGPVVFNIRSSTYEENGGTERVLYIEQQISGVSETNLITFQPDAASGATVDDVILKRIVGSYNDAGWIVEIRSDGIVLNELTLDYADTSTAGYHPNTTFAGIHIQGISVQINYISVIGCKIIRTSTVQRMRQGINVYGDANKIKIEYNLISHTFDGILFTNGGVKTNIDVNNNVLKSLKTHTSAVGSWKGFGIIIGNGQGNINVKNNIIDYRKYEGHTGFGVIAIHIINGFGHTIEANTVIEGQNDHWGQRSFTGIRCDGTNLQAKIVNNMVSSRSPGFTFYIKANNCEIYYNTIVSSLAGANGQESGTTCLINGTSNKIYNNMFIELRGGSNLRAVFDITDTTGNSINYNCYYKAQNDGKFIKANGVFYDSLSNWQNSGYDINSINKLPEFIDRLSDLHLGGCSVYDPELQAANPLNGFIVDLDGEERDAEFPYFGADEEDGTVPDIFTPADLTPTNDEALHFTSADLDGDGDNDIAVVNLETGSGDVSLFWNDGNANFTGPDHISFGSIPEVIKAENIDNDNAVDLLATSDGKLVVRYGSGGGNFDIVIDMPYQSDVEDFLFVDLDNDGDLDIFQTHLGTIGVQDGEVTQLINTGPRDFFFANLGNFYTGQHPSAATSGFINGDLFEDVVVVDFVNQIVSVLINLGIDGGGIWNGFSNGVEYPVFAGSSPLHANLSVGDLDGDGDADILIGSWGGGSDSLMILRNNGDGSFSDVEFFLVNDFRSSHVFDLFDYNDDGDLDIIVATPAHDLVYLSNEGNGNFVSFLLCNLSELGGEPLTILTKDFDMDSRPDVAVLTITDDIAVMLNLDYVVSVSEDKSDLSIPNKFSLEQNYPNPFNPSTTIRFELPTNAQVDLRVYNLLGQEVAVLINNEELSSGVYKYSFNASRLSSGVYFYRIITKDFVETKKMILLR